MLGDDLGDLLGPRIPGDHSRQVLADDYAARLRPARVMDLGCGAGDSIDLFRAIDPTVAWVGVDIEDSHEVSGRTRAEGHTFCKHHGIDQPEEMPHPSIRANDEEGNQLRSDDDRQRGQELAEVILELRSFEPQAIRRVIRDGYER